MPIYEYDCRGCRRRVSILVRSLSSQEAPRCPRCDSAELHRLMSRFATVKSEDARLDSLSDPSQFGDLDENDPRSVARMMKRSGGTLPHAELFGAIGRPEGIPDVEAWVHDWAAASALPSTRAEAPSVWA